jgi:hypothetical protein
MRIQQRTQLIFLSGLLASFASGCELFPGQDGAEFDDGGDESDTGTTDDGEDPPPTQGFRVFPKFMLQDLSAIVTIDLDGVTPLPCEIDGAPEGGYLCDASQLPAGGIATIVIEKDGFASAVRHPQLVYGQVTALDVHVAVEGGPSGIWSACHVAGDFSTCADLCATFQSSCVVTSCATADAEWPISTYETFADAECTTPVESVALACENELPLAGTVAALRCCCAS